MPPERIEIRSAEVGDGLYARRALPHRDRRMVGAWCFLDHLGPLDFEAGRGLRVGPHPHIGLQTFTWMIDGEVVHRDSLGNEQVIRPGQVNLMSAGHGIAHAEDSIEGQGGRLHAVQLWIALDQAHRHGAPSFRNYPDLPVIERDGFRVTLLAGSIFGETSPVEVFSPLVGMDITAAREGDLQIPLDRAFEYALLPLAGTVQVDGETFTPEAMAYLGAGRDGVRLRSDDASHFVLIGGAPFGEEILLWWNFVARTPEEIQAATDDWNAHRHFGEVHGSPSHPLVAPDVSKLRLRKPGN
ncbi:MAG TPA: pirin family protein [Rhodanobacteraceae bacterium]